ncbi:MAG: hypothetical protein JOY55_22205 [Mycobacterium sp.]|nr:hypothetical protein [Mycobacterium sp.]MBV8294480.1 hypothetical protein [Mycobacterium sp.]
MARHRLASDRRKSPVAMAAVVAPAALFFAVGGSADAASTRGHPDSVAEAAPCCVEVAATAATSSSWAFSSVSIEPGEMAQASRASRWRVVNLNAPKLLPVGVALERGLQVKTILAARAVSAAFPEIKNIGGVRPDSKPWHPRGLALDVMVPNPSSAQGIALGNEIVAFALKNAQRFSLQDCIWRGTYYTPSGRSGSGYGHYDHVHITTHGGGYPTGGEVYSR